MKEVTITINYDPEEDSRDKHDMECITTVNGTYYHNCLKAVYGILRDYAKDGNLSKPQKEIVLAIQQECFPHFKGVFHHDYD